MAFQLEPEEVVPHDPEKLATIQVVDLFRQKYQEILHLPYRVQGAKDGVAAKKLAYYPRSLLTRMIEEFLVISDDKFVILAGHTLAVLNLMANALAEKVKRAEAGSQAKANLPKVDWGRP